MSSPCPHCGCPVSDRMAVCPNCGTPKAPPVAVPPPMQAQAALDPDEVEIKKVGRFGLVVTSILIATAVLIVLAGAVLTFFSGCCGACSFNSPPPPKQDNPFVQYVWPIVGVLIALWVILAIVIFVIRQRKRR